MCGIAAVLDRTGQGVDRDALLRMRERMAARGPDGAGLWISEDRRVGLVHRRLAIIDLSGAGAQPMTSEDGKLIVVFNGEIYNHRELRSELESEGARFVSHSDTEVLLHLYRRNGMIGWWGSGLRPFHGHRGDRRMRILAILTDAYGGRGGIAQHNRHLLDALCAIPEVEEVIALPRIVIDHPGPLPEKLRWVSAAAKGKARYLQRAARLLGAWTRPEIVISGHLNLLPVAAALAAGHRSRLIQIVHGIEAWGDPGPLRRRLIRRVDTLVSVSDFTRCRVLDWADVPEERTVVIPNAIDLSRFGPGPRRQDLLARYGLGGKKVILTVGRLCASQRHKGHDEILELLPDLARELPEVAYLIVGDGDDRSRLEAKACSLGLADRVVFAGYVAEEEKADHYRLADVFAMPGRGEGFGIVYLEAMACGVPVIGSSADASGEVVLEGRLGSVIDPDDAESLRHALREAVHGFLNDRSKAACAEQGLAAFNLTAFEVCWQVMVQGGPAPAARIA